MAIDVSKLKAVKLTADEVKATLIGDPIVAVLVDAMRPLKVSPIEQSGVRVGPFDTENDALNSKKNYCPRATSFLRKNESGWERKSSVTVANSYKISQDDEGWWINIVRIKE